MGLLTDRIIVKNSCSELPTLIADYPQVFCVYDVAVEEYLNDIKAVCANIKSVYSITASEEHKTIETVLGISEWLLEQNANRNDLLITVGGGITSDMGGFAASIYKRGIAFAYVPTTLLSQVDAAIGGKTGVNLKSYKNILGTIIQPQFTYINIRTLDTLPKNQYLSGYAELLKTFIIGDAVKYQMAIDYLTSFNNDDTILVDLIQSAAFIKAGVVERDEFEKNERRHLNLGHTFAHAIEWYQRTHSVDKLYSHGESVAIGIYQATLMSESMGLCEIGLANRIKNDLKKCGMPTDLPFPFEFIEEAFLKDKKAERNGVNFVLICKLGKVITKLISKNDLTEIKRFFCL